MVLRIAVASAAMGATALFSHSLLETWVPSHALASQALRLGTAIGLALVVLAASAWLLRIHEFRRAAATIMRRVRRPAR